MVIDKFENISRLYCECSDEVFKTLNNITKSRDDVGNIILASALAIVRQMFFQVDESTIIITDENENKMSATVKLKQIEENNFFTVVKYVKESLKPVNDYGENNIIIAKHPIISEMKNCEFQFIWKDKLGKQNVEILFNEKLNSEEKLKYFARIFFRAILFFLKEPEKKVKQAMECFEEDYNLICEVFNSTTTEYPREKDIFTIFESVVNCSKKNTAIIYQDNRYTYENLYKMVCKKMKQLNNNGVKRDDVIGVFVDDKLEQIVSILSILGCGGIYLPIDTTYPEKRIEYMLNDSKAKYVILSKRFENKRLFNLSTHIILSNISIEAEEEELYELDREKRCGDDTAYIMYTSGSTGIPRGVEICHKSVLRLVKNNEFIKIREEDNVLQTSTIVFDASIFEVYGALLNGATLILSEKEDIIDPKRIKSILKKNNISVLWLTSPLFTQLSNEDISIFKEVKYLVVGGDVLSPKHINLVRKNCPGIQIVNGYGPTENTTFSTMYLIKNEFPNTIPIGKPISNSTVYIMNSSNELLPIGAVGEICVGGEGVARGYINNKQLNERKFINNPFGEGKLYLTGDNGFWTEDGNIEFIGRKDNQVKVNGFRVETAEIEIAAMNCTGVKMAFAVVENINNQKKIVLVYNGEKSVSHIKRDLKESLPMYMFPNIIIKMKKIPLNANGKLDRESIREEIKRLDDEKNEKEQLTEYEQIISDIVNSMSSVGYVKAEDNLFEMSFDSLKIAMLITNLNEIFHSDLNFSEVFLGPTIQEIATCLSNKNSKAQLHLTKSPELGRYIASSAQKRIFYSVGYDKEQKNYNVPIVLQFNNNIDIERVRKIWHKIINRHEALRTHFELENGELYQVIKTINNFQIGIYDSDEELVMKKVESLISRFDLEKDLLISVNMIYSGKSTYMMVDMHHIIIDGYSVNLILDEFCKLFRGETLEELIYQNKDVIYSKNIIFQEEQLEKQKKFWLSSLKEFEVADDIITDYKRDGKKHRSGYEKTYIIGNKEIIDSIKNYSVKYKSTIFSILLSCLYLTIWKYSRKDRIIAGVPFSGRTLSGMNQVVGMFVNVMPVLVVVEPEKTVEDFIVNVKDIILESYENQEYQFDSLVNELNISRDNNRNPLFNFTFNVSNNDNEFIINSDDKNEMKVIDINYNLVKFDFSIVAITGKDGLKLKIQYDKSLYQETTIDNFMKCYENMLHCIMEDGKKLLSDISIITDKEKQVIRTKFNNTKVHYTKYQNVIQVFEDTVSKFQDKVALYYDGKRISYKELYKIVNDRASYLYEAGVMQNDRVAILVDNKLEQIISILAILRAGGVYVPIDTDYPMPRISYILSDSEAKFMLTDQQYNNLDQININKIQISDMCTKAKTINIPQINTGVDNLAYIMYTSGTTGKPKGVMVKQKGILRLIISANYVSLNEHDNILQTSSIVFDASTFEIWAALFNGMTIYLTKKVDLLDFGKLKKLIHEKKITVMWLTAPLFKQIAECCPECFMELKWLLIGGDTLPKETVLKVKSICSDLRMINGYGPTENTTFSTTYEITSVDCKTIPIGKPINNSNLYIFDEWMHLQPIGAVGEIYVGGDGLAEGYVNDKNKTKEKFRVVNIDGKSKMLYATGDLGFWKQDGNVTFIGRKDNQIKIRGFRIEPDEILKVALENGDIKESVVIVYEEEEKSLVLFYISDNVTEDKLRKVLRDKLPEFMVPKYIIRMEDIPLNINGKVDISKLKDIVDSYKSKEYHSESNILFNSQYEKEIHSIWSEQLQVQIKDIDVNFFDAGGNSMSLMKIYEKLNSKFGKKVNISDMFTYTTIRELALCYEERNIKTHQPAIMKLKDELINNFNAKKKQYVHYVFSISKEEFEILTGDKTINAIEANSMILLLWSMVISGYTDEVVNLNVYDESQRICCVINKIIKNQVFSIQDLFKEKERLNKFLENIDKSIVLSDFDYDSQKLELNMARVLFSNGRCKEEESRYFSIVMSVIQSYEEVEFELKFDQYKYNELQMKKIMESFSNTINFVLNNIKN